MRTAPLSPVAIGLILGVMIQNATAADYAVGLRVFGGAAVLGLCGTLRRAVAPMIVLLAAVGVGISLHTVATTGALGDLQSLASPDGPVVRLRGTVSSTPTRHVEPANPFAKWIHTGASTSFLLDVEGIEGSSAWISASGRVRVTVASAVLDADERDRVEVFGRLHALTPPANPGATDWRSYFLRQGIVARLSSDGRRNIRRLEPTTIAAQDALAWLRQRTRDLLIDEVAAGAPEESTLLEAMVLGHRSRFDRRLDEIFTRAGVIHFIAVSGTNVVVLMGFVWLLGRLFHRTKRQCTAAMVATILLYVCIAEPRPPILRATIMGLLFCAALWTGRARAHLNWLSASAVILIVIDSGTVFDVGFQLSFVAVLGVAYLGPALMNAASAALGFFRVRILRDPYANLDAQLARAALDGRTDLAVTARRAVRAVVKTVAATLMISLAAWFATLPIIVLNFHTAQPWAPLSSALVFPMMSLVMVLGLAKVLVGGLSILADTALGTILGTLDAWLIRLVELLAALPGAGLSVPTPPWWLVLLFYLFLLAFVFRFRSSKPKREETQPRTKPADQPQRSAALICASVLFAAGSATRLIERRHEDSVVITVLAVGRGSATVIELPDDRTLVYDAGSSFASDPAPSAIVPYLCHRGIARVDRLFVSHPNLDHFSGIPGLLDRIPSGSVVLNSCFEPNSEPRSAGRHLLNLLKKKKHPVETFPSDRRKWSEGDVTFELLWPDTICDPTLSANDASTVLRLTVADRSILFTGDIEKRAQQALLDRGNLHADVLILPHHGSVEPTTQAFIRAVNPSVVLRSTHERTADTVNGLQARIGPAALYNTADLGAIQVALTRDGIEIATPQVPSYSPRR